MFKILYNNNINKMINTRAISILNIKTPSKLHYNLTYKQLMKHENKNREGITANTEYGNVFSISTGKFTGRSPNDKWIVNNKDSMSSENIWWGDVNRQITPEIFQDLYKTATDHFSSLDEFYVYDGYCGTNPKSRKRVRFVHEMAWQQHFVKNMFIESHEKENFKPDFTIINACSKTNEKWENHNLNSDTAIAFNIEEKLAVILGTWYGGENKKGMFSLMNYWLPLQNIMTMHCSANVGTSTIGFRDTALFFGLSGTGKTTLSADPKRQLVGDDEHGWDSDGIFNLEGGCYAKTIDLTEENEPDIFRAIRPNALLENVYIDNNKRPDYSNTSITQNGRVSYPIDHIDNFYQYNIAPHPKNIIFLTCDAFGILPPVSILTPGQAMYHFLSGYTAKIAGTERGITEPQATFSSCFGEAFLTLDPVRYAELFEVKLKLHKSNAFLVNTGWTGGSYGVGERMSIAKTRKCIDSILDGTIHNCEVRTDELFGFKVPVILEDVPCDPRETWENKTEYHETSVKLAKMFQDNYKTKGFTNYSEHGPILSSKL